MDNNLDREQQIRRKRRAERLRKKRRQRRIQLVLGSLIVVLAVILIFLVVRNKNSNKTVSASTADTNQTNSDGEGGSLVSDAASTDASDTASDGATSSSPEQSTLDQASLLAAGYDYDGAITLLQGVTDYQNNTEITDAIKKYEEIKATCVPVDVTTVPHIFYHSLINNTDKVFDGDYKEADYNCWYATIAEFDKITQQMYDNGWVIVRLRDLVTQTTDADGTVHFTPNTSLMLPPNKKAVVFSVDDLSYYHFGDGDGFPDKIVVDENGKPKCQVTNDDGTVDIGDYDVVPRLNTFLEEHPDGCYKGARGLIALTGYNGVLGYRTDIAYKTHEKLDGDQQDWLNAHPDFNWDQDVADATKAADAIKASGWEFASHTWGHARAGTRSAESLIEDNEKWMAYVEPITGATDTIIFAHGEDIAGLEDYTSENAKYAYYKNQGFNFYCNVDSNCWQQISDSYVRQGRLDIDGYTLYKSKIGEKDYFSKFFNAAEVFDPVRPTPVELAG